MPTQGLSITKSVMIEGGILQKARHMTGREVIAATTPWSPRIGGKSSGASRQIIIPAAKDAARLFIKSFGK